MVLAPFVLGLSLQASPHPVLDAFERACVTERSSMAALSRSLEAGGWTRVSAAAHPELLWEQEFSRRAKALNSEWVSATGYDAQRSRIYWSRGEGDRRLFVLLEQDYSGEPEGRFVTVTATIGCTVIDLRSVSPVPLDQVNAWLGHRESSDSNGMGVETGVWDVSSRWDNALKVTVSHTPTGSLAVLSTLPPPYDALPGAVMESTTIAISSIVAVERVPVLPGFEWFDGAYELGRDQ